MPYVFPTLIADEDFKRLHARLSSNESELLPQKCDLVGETSPTVNFMEAVRLINEEAYRPCGNCLMEGGEISNWRERALAAEADVAGLNSQLEQAEQLQADFKERAEQAEQHLQARTLEGSS